MVFSVQKTCFYALVLLGVSAFTQQSIAEPKNIDGLHAYVALGGDLYLGELHGSNEVPKLFSSLVKTAVLNKRNTKRKLIISLEKSSDARDLNSWFWEGTDGRSSGAMWDLVKYLLSEELAGNLELHFQHSKEALSSNKTANEKEEIVGRQIAALSDGAQVLILGGNVHSSKDLSYMGEHGVNLKTVGMFLNEDMLHITVAAIADSETWACFVQAGSQCGVQKIKSYSKGSKAGSLINGESAGHDYILFIPSTSASPPKYSNRDRSTQ